MISRGTQLKFNCGDLVRERDGRHIGKVAAAWKWTVRVIWIDTGIKEDLSRDDLVLVEKRGRF